MAGGIQFELMMHNKGRCLRRSREKLEFGAYPTLPRCSESLYSSMEEVNFVLTKKGFFEVHVCLKKALVYALRYLIIYVLLTWSYFRSGFLSLCQWRNLDSLYLFSGP